MVKVFVYGTLKEGFPNFDFNEGIRCRGNFETLDKYPLYLVGERYTPWLILTRGNGNPVKGQVFEVSQASLTNQDRFEGIDQLNGYRRASVRVKSIEGGEQLDAFIYGKPTDRLKQSEIRCELAGEYLPEHAKLYCRRQH